MTAELKATAAELRALTAAVEILRQQMADLPLAIVTNMEDAARRRADAERPRGPADPDRPRRAPPSRGGGASAGLAALAGSFAKLLGPLAALGTFLNASTSGFDLFNKAIKLFATTLAPVLMPAFFLLAVALAATSEVLWGQLAPALEGMFGVILNYGIPTIVRFLDMVLSAAEALEKLSKMDTGVGGVKGADLLAAGALVVPGLQIPAGMYLYDRAAGGSGDGRAYGDRIGGGTRDGARGATGRAIADTLAELRLSMGPQASTGNISSVYSKAQMAALNQSPFERRMLEMMERVTGALTRASIEPGRGLTGGGGTGGGGPLTADRMGAAIREAMRRRGG